METLFLLALVVFVVGCAMFFVIGPALRSDGMMNAGMLAILVSILMAAFAVKLPWTNADRVRRANRTIAAATAAVPDATAESELRALERAAATAAAAVKGGE